jgi:preprotein translocase subunit SecE
LPAYAVSDQTARVTFPERKHLVQTFFLLTVPFSLTLTVWMFAFHFRLVCLLEWETLLPET